MDTDICLALLINIIIHRFTFIRTCGCVLSEKALKEVPSENCHKVISFHYSFSPYSSLCSLLSVVSHLLRKMLLLSMVLKRILRDRGKLWRRKGRQ